MLADWVRRMREQILLACSTLQYDSAVLAAEQPPEPFTSRQQRLSRMDGGIELDGTVRDLVEVTGAEQPGHLLLEDAAAVAEQRPLRHPYKETSLRGAIQSLLPTWRLSQWFGRIVPPDERGHYEVPARVPLEDRSCDGSLNHQTYSVEDIGEVSGFIMPEGREATSADLRADAEAWAVSFARDQRACHSQNHEHACTGTCIKNQPKPKTTKPDDPATERPVRAGQTIKGESVPLCRFWFFRVIVFYVEDSVKKVLRRGKALVPSAFIASTNEKNEYGRATPFRGQPFRSSTCDVLQCAIRCNADYQYMTRAVPDEELGTDAGKQADHTPLFFGWSRLRRVLSASGKRFLQVLAVSMRASYVADFYMTKYLAKAQQMLGTALNPLVAGMRRYEETGGNEDDAQLSLNARARRIVRKLIFMANRSHWFSACELGIYLQTGQTYISSTREQVIFTSRGICMMHECQRLLSGDTPCKGLLYAAAARQPTDACASGFEFVATEQPATKKGPRGDEEPAAKRLKTKAEATSPILATEHPLAEADATELSSDDGSEDERSPMALPVDQGVEAATGPERLEDEKHPRLQAFSKTFSVFDDWLHRGDQLQDMQLYHYVRHVERCEIPRKGDLATFLARVGGIFLFDEHYKPVASSYVQILRPSARTVRVAGPQCVRKDVNEGEDNANYKSFFFSTFRCPGAGECSNPLLCKPLLCTSPNGSYKFHPCWRPRLGEILTLASRAQVKKDTARRVSVIRDTTLCKGMRIPRLSTAHGHDHADA